MKCDVVRNSANYMFSSARLVHQSHFVATRVLESFLDYLSYSVLLLSMVLMSTHVVNICINPHPRKTDPRKVDHKLKGPGIIVSKGPQSRRISPGRICVQDECVWPWTIHRD